jgi:hypothetical protein
MQVSNMDIADLADRTCSFAREMGTSQSAFNGGAMLEADILRAAAYYDSLETMLGIYEANPLDMPKSHNIGFSLLKTFLTDEEVEAIENMPVKAKCGPIKPCGLSWLIPSPPIRLPVLRLPMLTGFALS